MSGAWIGRAMRTRQFLARVRELLEGELPPRFRPFHSRIFFTLLQVHYGDPRIHYEVWVQRKTGRLEIGLHFEGEQGVNHRWASHLAQRAPEIQAALGPQVELEEWTQSWTRLHQTLPLAPLGEEMARQAASRLAAMVQVLQPILERGVPPAGGG